jgi:type I restriction enzyme, R subunit
VTQEGSRLPSNFLFLEAEWPALYAEALKAEQNVFADPRAACFYARRTLELAVRWIYDADRSLRPPYKTDLSSMLLEPAFAGVVEAKIRAKMDLVRKQGNAAVHRSQPIDASEAQRVVRELFHLLYWLARTYSRNPGGQPPAEGSFDSTRLPRSSSRGERPAGREALRRQAEADAVRETELANARRIDPNLKAELERLRSEVDAAKSANQKRPDLHDYDEEETRDLYIDLLLKEAGWLLNEKRDREFPVTGMPSKSGRGQVDYVLWGDDGKPLALLEAKRSRRDPRAGRQQAKLYADCLEARFGRRPVIFYSNGYEIWLWDDHRYPPRVVQGFFTKAELDLMIRQREERRPLGETEIDSKIVDRPYQHRAIRRIGERFEEENQRGALVVMATGAGKTRTAIALVDQMMRAGWVKRVLFLADRLALVKQAANAFRNHLPEVPTVNLVTDHLGEGRVYVSTYPTMMGRLGEVEAGEERRFGPGFFDLVIIDEAHRSVYQKYRAIFSYFDSFLLGLTATPKNEVDRNTYSLFNLDPGVPTDAYGLDEAVADGYLVPPRAITVPLKFPLEGMKYADLPEEEREEWEAQDWGEEGEIPREVSAEAVNRWLFNSDTVDKVLEALMTRGHRVQGGDRLGKTIIFAKNIEHAEFIVERLDANYPEWAGSFARAITHSDAYAQSLIDDFSDKDKSPHIAISVDMLDTGIDVPEVVNLVFFKKVRSQTKFWQMLGRGTRLCPNLYAPGKNKKDFFVFDCCDNISYFNQQIEPSRGAPSPSLTQRLFRERLELVLTLAESQAASTGAKQLRNDTISQLRTQIAGMNPDNFLVRPHRQWVERFREPGPWADLDLETITALADHLAALPAGEDGSDEEARRFDLMILGLQLRLLKSQPGGDRLRRQVQEICAGLLEQNAIPAVREQEALLEEVSGGDWWENVTLELLEGARKSLRDLVRLLEKRKRAVVYTDFTDELSEVEEVSLIDMPMGPNYDRFVEKARAYLRAHEDHVSLQKLRRNVPLTALDLEELERMLLEAGVANEEDLEEARRESAGLGIFIRSLIGLERIAATEAFTEFIQDRTFNASQLHFINLIIDHLTANGIMDPGLLYEPPFTDVAPHGPEDLFPTADVKHLIETIRKVGRNSEPPSDSLAS